MTIYISKMIDYIEYLKKSIILVLMRWALLQIYDT